jgi:hypothetical protein
MAALACARSAYIQLQPVSKGFNRVTKKVLKKSKMEKYRKEIFKVQTCLCKDDSSVLTRGVFNVKTYKKTTKTGIPWNSTPPKRWKIRLPRPQFQNKFCQITRARGERGEACYSRYSTYSTCSTYSTKIP